MFKLALQKLTLFSFSILIFLVACGEEAKTTKANTEHLEKNTTENSNKETPLLKINDLNVSDQPKNLGSASRSQVTEINQTPVVDDQDESFGSLLSKAESGEADSQFKVAGIYEIGSDDVSQNLLEAARWYRMAAEQNHAQAQYNLGMMYQSGHGVGEDANEANKWFERYNQNK